ncbi:MAG TPA: hypothetical protein DDW19_05650 [Anaerolineaceae bacterium]|jgi:hypothetical protein|nr:hypothetical protein [Anaerolineaceae bacterium]
MPDDSLTKKRRSWLVWVVFVLILVAVPLNFVISSINPMQRELEQCNLNYDLRKTPGSDAPELTMKEFNRCLDMGSSASTYFFLTSLNILFSASALEGLMAGKVRALVASSIGLGYVILVSLIMGGGFPLAFFSVNAPIVALIFWLWKRKELD